MKQLAQTVNFGGYTIEGPVQDRGGAVDLAGGNIGAIIGSALPYVFAFAGIGLLLMIISSGFAIMLSRGDSKKMEMGRSRLTNAIVGFLIIFVAYWATQMVGVILGWQESIGTIFQ